MKNRKFMKESRTKNPITWISKELNSTLMVSSQGIQQPHSGEPPASWKRKERATKPGLPFMFFMVRSLW